MDAQRCGSCKQVKPVDEFSPCYRGKPGTWCRPCVAAYHRGQRVVAQHEPRTCIACGMMYTPVLLKSNASYCSPECKDAARNAALRAACEAAKPWRICLQCGGDIPPAMRVDARFCSAECNNRAHALKRKLRVRGGQGVDGYVRVQIAERDGWRCGICRKAVNRNKRHPDPLCGSLDHVVPVCEGGTSEPANLRITHLVCNLRRRAGGGDEQLAII